MPFISQIQPLGSTAVYDLKAAQLVTARTFTIGSTSRDFDGTTAVSWTHADIGATVNSNWTTGTTAGPILNTIINSVTATATIPAASTGNSGVVNTDKQGFSGIKVFTNGIELTDSLYREYSSSSATPMIWMNGNNYDSTLWSISTSTSTRQYYGYNLRYIGTGTNENKLLRLNADNQNGTDITAVSFNQNGQLGIGYAIPDTNYRVSVEGAMFNNNSLTFNTSADQGIIKNIYSGTAYNVIRNHNNGSISLSAASAGLYVGYENTTLINWLNSKMYMHGTTGNLGIGTISPSQRLHVNNGLAAITNNENTVTIGSQNTSFTHIYNSADIPFIFNKDVDVTDKHWLGSTSFPWGGLRLGGTAPAIQFQGSKANYTMIQMIDNATDAYGNGIAIGGGGQTIIGGGESANALRGQAGTAGAETMWIGNDGAIEFFPNQQNGYTDAQKITMQTNGSLIVHSVASSWINGLKINNAAVNITDSTDTGSYWPWMRQINSAAGRCYSFGNLNDKFYLINVASSATANAYASSVIFNGPTGELGVEQGSIYAGVENNTSAERRVEVRSGAGRMYMWSHAATAGSRGIYLGAHGGCAAHAVFTVDYQNRCSFADYYNATMTKLAYSQAGMAASAMTWMTCWNGYELRAISKAETANVVDSARKFVRLAGDTMTGYLKITTNNNTVTFGSQNTSYCHFTNSANIPFYFNKAVHVNGSVQQYTDAVDSRSWINGRDSAAVRVARFNNYHAGLSMKTTNGSYEIGVYTNNNFWITYTPDSNYNSNTNSGYTQVHMSSDGKWWGAVWNDYAEFRKDNELEKDIQKPGCCVKEIGDGRLELTTKRLERGCEIISDTFGFSIGQDEKNNYNTPIASSGRVLAYPYESIEEFKKHIGYAVCSGPGGTVSIMTDEEEEKYPLRAIGTISEIPDYEIWGTGEIKVDGRIWIRIR